MRGISGSSPIGVFDSGIGGLTVVRALMTALPREDLLYVGDTARVPYGIKSPATITRYAREITRFLLGCNVKLLIVACNTMSAVALPGISDLTPLPVMDVIRAGAGCALASTRNKRIGVIGTPATIKSMAYPEAIKHLDQEARIFSQACPLFVSLVEEGWLNKKATRLIAEEYLAPLLEEDIDTLILGCTHYPLLKPLLQEIAGPGVTLIDSAESVAQNTRGQMEALKMLNPGPGEARRDFFVTDALEHFQRLGESFLGCKIETIRLISLQQEQA